MDSYELLAAKGCGSAIVEAAFALTGAPVRITDASPYEEGAGKERLRSLNPLLQVPTLVLPDGRVMTESAAIILHLADRYPEAGLAPPPDAFERPEFLHWLIFLVGAVYPTFTFGDVPARYVSGQDAEDELRRTSDAARETMYRQMEAVAGTPWFLGGTFSAIDLYMGAMVSWRPRRAWFAEHCPKLDAIATRTRALPALADVWTRNFD